MPKVRSTENRKMLIGCDGSSPQAARTKQSMVSGHSLAKGMENRKMMEGCGTLVHVVQLVVVVVHCYMGTWVHRCTVLGQAQW